MRNANPEEMRKNEFCRRDKWWESGTQLLGRAPGRGGDLILALLNSIVMVVFGFCHRPKSSISEPTSDSVRENKIGKSQISVIGQIIVEKICLKLTEKLEKSLLQEDHPWVSVQHSAASVCKLKLHCHVEIQIPDQATSADLSDWKWKSKTRKYEEQGAETFIFVSIFLPLLTHGL